MINLVFFLQGANCSETFTKQKQSRPMKAGPKDRRPLPFSFAFITAVP